MRCQNFRKPWFLVIFVPVGIVAVGFLVMALWNWLIPSLFSGPAITFWQSLGILLLAKILFGGHGHSPGQHDSHRENWREHMKARMGEGGHFPIKDRPAEPAPDIQSRSSDEKEV